MKPLIIKKKELNKINNKISDTSSMNEDNVEPVEMMLPEMPKYMPGCTNVGHTHGYAEGDSNGL